MVERASGLVNEAMTFIKQAQWEYADQCLQKIYSTLPKDPAVLIRSILINAYLTSETIPTDQKSKFMVISADEQAPTAVVNGASMVKSAIEMANQVNLKSNDIYLDIIRCFLDIAGKYLFSEGQSWASLFPLLIETALKTKAPNTWLILLLMADSFSHKDNDKDLALNRLDAVFSVVESDQESANTFYACILASINTDFLQKVYPKWESNMALNLYVKITRIRSKSEAISLDTFESLQDNLKTFIKTHHTDKLSKGLNYQSLVLKLASVALKCEMPARSKELLSFVTIFERNSATFIEKEYLLAELAFYDLEKSKSTDLFKRSMILVGLAEAVDIATRSHLCVQLINQGCIMIWNASRPYFPTPKFHKYRELITALKICANALDNINSSLKVIRAKIHYELSQYFYYQDFIPKASDHVNKALALSISDDPIEKDLRLLQVMIAVKNGDVYESREFRVVKNIYHASETKELALAVHFFKRAVNEYIPDFDDTGILSIKGGAADNNQSDLNEALPQNDQLELRILEYFLQSTEDLAELFLSRFKSATTCSDLDNDHLKKLWLFRVAISNFVLDAYYSKSLSMYYQEKKACIYLIKSKSIQKACFDLNSHLEPLDVERNSIIEGLLNACQIAKTIQNSILQINACTEVWNFFQRYHREQTNAYWTSIFQKLYSFLQESSNLSDYSLYKYIAATYALMLLKEAPVVAPIAAPKETSKAKSAKGNTKGLSGKEDTATSNLVQVEEIINAALIKSPYIVESQLFLISVWSQMHCIKSEKIPEQISHVDQVTELFSSLEISGLPSEKREGISVDNLLKTMILTALSSADLPIVLQIEIIARISQFAIIERYFSTASGCLEAGFQALLSCSNLSSSVSEAKMLLELVKSQFLICLLAQNMYIEDRDDMISESFNLTMSALTFGLKSDSNLHVEMLTKLFGNLINIMHNLNDTENKYFMEIRQLLSSFKKWPKLRILLQNEAFLLNLESMIVLLSDYYFENERVEDGVALCDLADKLIPKSQLMTLKRYKWLSWMGKQSCFLKVTQEDMALVWLRQALKATEYNKKMRAFELCIKESTGTTVELESIVCFLEWKESVHNLEKYLQYLNRLKDVLNLENTSTGYDRPAVLLLRLRASILLVLKERSLHRIQALLQFAISTILDLLQTTQSESLQMVPREEVKENPSKGKRDKDTGNNKFQLPDLPKELNDWASHLWPPIFQQCYNECKKDTVFCSIVISDKTALLHSLFSCISSLSTLKLHGSIFLFTKFISLISNSSKEIAAALALIEADALICMGKTTESKLAFKTFFKNQLVGVSNAENTVIYTRSLFLQGKILLKYGYSIEAKNALVKSRNAAIAVGDEHLLSEIDILLAFLNIFFGHFLSTKTLIRGITGKCTKACMLMDSSLALLFSETLQSKLVHSDKYFFIESIINQITHHEREYSVEDTAESLFTLKWIQLRLLRYIHQMNGQQKFTSLVSIFETCTEYGEKISDNLRLKAMQSDYIQGLWSLFKVEKGNKNRRQIKNCCFELIKKLESKFLGVELQLDSFDYRMILNILMVELDHLISPVSEEQSKNVDDILDDFLVNITDPPVQIPDSCSKLLSSIPTENIPENLRGEFLCLKLLYGESRMEIEAKLQLLKECISKLYLSKSNEFLKKALEKYLYLNFSELSLIGLKTLARLQALDGVSYLRQTLLNFRNATVEHAIVEVLKPWISRFITVDPEDLYSNLGNARLYSMISPREDLNIGLLPKSVKILIFQHSLDKKTLFVGALKRKNDIKQKGNQKGGEDYDLAMIMYDVNHSNLSKIKNNIWKLRSCGSSGSMSAYDENSTKSLVYDYLSCISESKEIREILITTPKAESIPIMKGSARSTKTTDPNKKAATEIKPRIVESDHVVILCDDSMSHLPLESYLSETFGVQSSSRDFSLQTVLDRYKFSEPPEASQAPADPKKKEKTAPTQSEDIIQSTGISYLMDTEDLSNFFNNAAKLIKPNPKLMGYTEAISALEMRSLVKDYSIFLYSGKEFNDSILHSLSFLNSPRTAVILEHNRPKNQGTEHLLYSRQKKLSALMSLLGFDSIIITNCNLSRKEGEEMLGKVLEGTHVGKLSHNSISSYSMQKDACPIPGAIAYGLNLPIDY